MHFSKQFQKVSFPFLGVNSGNSVRFPLRWKIIGPTSFAGFGRIQDFLSEGRYALGKGLDVWVCPSPPKVAVSH